MSGRKITRFILRGLLSIVVIIPIWAQDPNPTAVTTQTPSHISKPMPGKLSGTWYRQADGYVVAATFAQDELKVCTTINSTLFQLIMTGYYTVMIANIKAQAIGRQTNCRSHTAVNRQCAISS
jgi:hypothetical protein